MFRTNRRVRRVLEAGALLALAAACSDIGGPVSSVDGNWIGEQNGYSLGLSLAQKGDTVNGSATITGAFGTASGTASGFFDYPNLNITFVVTGFDPVVYAGTMSTTQAKINGQLNGSGYQNFEIDVHKK